MEELDAPPLAKEKTAIFFIVDGPKYQAQAILLAATLRYFNNDRYQLIAGQRHAIRVSGDVAQHPGVHDVELHVGMGAAVVGAP